MKHIILITSLFLFTLSAFSQSISGTVTNNDNEGLIGAIVELETVGKSLTDNEGKFSFSNVPNGTYDLNVHYIGYETYYQKITIDGSDIPLSIQLADSPEGLQSVEIIGRKNTIYKPDVTFSGTKTGADVKEIPQTISVLNKEIIKDQGLFRIKDIAQNVAGVTRTRPADDFTSRGFRVSHDYINGNRALIAPDFAASTIASQYERIEFIKGPAAALFGNSSPGGVINAVTKKPLKNNRAGATVSVGSFNTKRATMDLTGPVTDDKKLLYRFNLGWENAESFRDFLHNRSILFAPTFSFIPNDKTSFNLDIVGTFNNDDAGIDRGMPMLQEDLFALPINFSAAEPYDTRQNSSVLVTATGRHKFSDNLSLNVSYTRSDFDQTFIETRSSNNFTVDGSELIRAVNNRTSSGYSDFATAYITGKFTTGSMIHNPVIGFDFYDTKIDSETRAAAGESNGVPNLVFKDRVEYKSLSQFSINFSEAIAGFTLENGYTGLYVQDKIDIDRLHLLLSLRYEDLNQDALVGDDIDLTDNIDNKVLLPRFGATYDVTKNASLYASYTQSFQPQNIPNGLNTVDPGQEFNPLESNQVEVGAKANFFNNGLLAQLSVYNISRKGRLIEDPNGGAGVFRLLQVGDETSKGFEIETTGNIKDNFTATANYAYNKVDVLDDSFAITQLELENNNPEHAAGIWGKYTIEDGSLRNLSLGLGGNYVSQTKIVNQGVSAINPNIYFDDYTTVKAGIYYFHRNLDFSLNVKNIFDERYFVGGLNAGRVFPGAPRNYLASVGYTF